MADHDPKLVALAEEERPRIEALMRREAGGLLRYESVDDLVQGAILKLLGAPHAPDDDGVRPWIAAVGRAHVADRYRYWKACRRDGGHLLRITRVPDRTTAAGVQPADGRVGPASFAERRDDLALAARAVAALPERDRELVEDLRKGLSVDETADRLGVSYAAAQRARLRAQERFVKALRLLTSPPGREA